VDQANMLKADLSARRVIRRSRWLLLRNRGNLTDDQAVKLDDLLAANAPLTTVYALKAQLRELWCAPDEDEARRRWNEWQRLAMDSQLPPLIAFAKRLAPSMASSPVPSTDAPPASWKACTIASRSSSLGRWLSRLRLLLPQNQGCLSR
jgi:hypothetical protein